MAKSVNDDAHAVRFPASLVGRARALIEPIAADPELGIRIGRMSVTAVLRLAAHEGLKVLETKYANGEKP